MIARPIAALLLALAVLVLGFSSTAFAGIAPPVYMTGGKVTGKHVFDVEDSITDISSHDIGRSLSRYSYVIDATVGITMARQLPTIQHVVATTPPQYWIVEHGTKTGRIRMRSKT